MKITMMDGEYIVGQIESRLVADATRHRPTADEPELAAESTDSTKYLTKNRNLDQEESSLEMQHESYPSIVGENSSGEPPSGDDHLKGDERILTSASTRGEEISLNPNAGHNFENCPDGDQHLVTVEIENACEEVLSNIVYDVCKSDEPLLAVNNSGHPQEWLAKHFDETRMVNDDKNVIENFADDKIADDREIEVHREPMDNFIIQRDYIPEHLLHESDDSSDDDSSSSSSSSSSLSSSSSSSSSSLSSSASSSCSSNSKDDKPIGRINKSRCAGRNVKKNPSKIGRELDPTDLPPIENLKISVNREEIRNIGHILSIIDCLVVVQGIADCPALNLDSVLFFEDGESLGQIFEIFGPVIRPLFSVRFNTMDDIRIRNVAIGAAIFYAPNKTELTNFVFTEQLRRMKASDASWRNEEEPDESCLDFSDDELEKMAKARLNNIERRDDVDDYIGNNNDEESKEQRYKRPAFLENKRGGGGGRGIPERQRIGVGGRGYQSNMAQGGQPTRSDAPRFSSTSIRPAIFQPSGTMRPAMFQPPNLSRPPPDFSRPPTGLSRPPPDLSRPPPDLSRPPPDLSRPAPDLSRPPPDMSRPPPDLSRPPPPDLSRPPPNFSEPPPSFISRYSCARLPFNEASGHSSASYPHNPDSGQYNRPPWPVFTPRLPPSAPAQFSTPSASLPAPIRHSQNLWTRPRFSSHTSIGSLLSNHNQQSATVFGQQPEVPSTTSLSQSSASNVLPNPFRVPDEATENERSETASIPRFPPLGFRANF